MWVEQRIGPFPKGVPIFFPSLDNKQSGSAYQYKYVRFGVQVPQAPYVTETKKLLYSQYDKDGFPIVESGLVPVEESQVLKGMYKFKIGQMYGKDKNNAYTYNIDESKVFCINANEILEFFDMKENYYFLVVPQEDWDAYTTIEIQYIDELES